MKKIIIYSFIVTVFTTNLNAGIFGGRGGGGFGKIVGIVTKISNTQLKMYTEEVKQGINQVEMVKNQVEQLQNQFQQLQNDAKNLKQIGRDLSSGNLNSIKMGLDKILDLDAQLTSSLFKSEDFLRQFNTLYRDNDQLSEPYKQGLEAGVNENRKVLANIRRETSKVIFDTMKNAGYNPTLNDKRNIEMLISKANTTEGALQALQAGNNILGQMALTLVEIRNVLSKTAVMASAVSEETRTVTNMEEQKKQNTLNDYHKKNEDLVKRANEMNNKFKNEKINVNWGGVK